MIIDFHAHVFPEKIAARALGKLAEVSRLTPSTDGTVQGLQASMARSGVDLSVVLPVVTDPRQFDSILRFAASINETCSGSPEDRLISLAGMHPADEHYKEHLSRIKQEGFRGIKVHPNYQGIQFSDIRTKRLLAAASELGLVIVTHAGYDPYTPEEEFASPDMILEVLRDVAPEKLVLAHMGSNRNYKEAEERLYGQKVYLDTAFSITELSHADFVRMVRKHGADRVLFATDVPWTDQGDCVRKLESSALTAEEKELISCKNAMGLLGLK